MAIRPGNKPPSKKHPKPKNVKRYMGKSMDAMRKQLKKRLPFPLGK